MFVSPRPDPHTLRTAICRVEPLAALSHVVQTPLGRSGALDWESVPTSDWRYEILNPIGQGGMATVHLARDRLLGRMVAVKLLGTTARERFRREACLHAILQHPAIAPLFDAGRLADGRYFLAVKYVAGQSLSELAAEPPASVADLDDRLGWFEQVGHAVAYAHAKHVLHRDLKPENVLVSTYGRVFVIDWGLAKRRAPSLSGDDAGTGETAALGTLAYMAPEQAAGAQDATEETDVFGLGATLCALLSGRPPYVGNPTDVVRMVRTADTAAAVSRLKASATPRQLIRLVQSCLARKPEDRPKTAQEVVDAVIQFRHR